MLQAEGRDHYKNLRTFGLIPVTRPADIINPEWVKTDGLRCLDS